MLENRRVYRHKESGHLAWLFNVGGEVSPWMLIWKSGGPASFPISDSEMELFLRNEFEPTDMQAFIFFDTPESSGTPEPDAHHCIDKMPKYRCHKEVHALTIAGMSENSAGDTWMAPYEAEHPAFKLPRGFVVRHKPEVGGRYVVYENGYVSYSPAATFEKGYTRI